MTTPFENRNYSFAGAFVDELARCGLRHVCICPGSRSSPLALSFGRHPAITQWMHLDERSAAFFALGMTRLLREPVAIVCSSGTAAANLHPAVAEAHNDCVPLLVLTADRPPEAVGWGALQTMEQDGMYGRHAKWAVTLPPPEATAPLLAYVRSVAGRAWATARAAPAGPVHVNLPFREPLEPVPVPGDFTSEGFGLARQGRAGGSPFLSAPPVQRRLAPGLVERLTLELASKERGLIVCGPQEDGAFPEAVSALARRLGYPMLADVLSQVRCGPHDRAMVVDGYDAFLRDNGVVASLAPEVVLRFGAAPVSKPLTQYLERHPSARHVLVDDGSGWRDPSFLTAEVIQADAAPLCCDLAAALPSARVESPWLRRWLSLNGTAKDAIARHMKTSAEMFEGRVFAELASLLPHDAILFAGNSMPVRDVDSFFPTMSKKVRFLANRGVSGIDGVVSTALGAAAASGRRIVLVIGDISFYHDMNGLLAAKAHKLNATIIVINNDGGGIFSFLPQAAYTDVFETYFGTPHGLTFKAAAELYGLGYTRVEDWRSYRSAVSHSLTDKGVAIIEVPVPARDTNVALHRQVWQAVGDAIGVAVRP
ncbi:MAG: 2-succinyl-5-enolpyruvyl-6-hydroxy-3-cyclohexene-1-carboxylic-acid synthase [Chloroflexi bacterium]|nr:2-succinyl-5-enolpyruvyl-6-hydroxy-3-cyclohexene-1-carboxylic-acid synthase [Chloroflexota bacterium]